MSIPNGPRERIDYQGSSADSEVESLKRYFVVQLRLGRGSYFKAIQHMRERWSIETRTGLPRIPDRDDGHIGFIWPEDKPTLKEAPPLRDLSLLKEEECEQVRSSDLRIERHNFNVFEYEQAWVRDVREIWANEVPGRLQQSKGFWESFISACVVYQPPEEELLAFAALFPVRSRRITTEHFGSSSRDVYTTELPIRMIPDPKDIEQRMRTFFDMVLDEFNKRYLTSLGLDAHEMKREVEIDPDSGLFVYLWESAHSMAKWPYIEINEWTTDADVTDSHKAIRAKLRASNPHESENSNERKRGGATFSDNEKKPKSRPSRDPLTALQAAILHDRLNELDKNDRRRKKWTYSKIATHLNLVSPRAAEDHVKVGRQMLKSQN